MRPLPSRPLGPVYGLISPPLATRLLLWNYADGRGGRIGHVVTASAGSTRGAPKFLTYTDYGGGRRGWFNALAWTLTNVPTSTISRDDWAARTALEEAASPARPPWQGRIVMVGAELKEFSVFPCGRATIGVSRDETFPVAFLDTRSSQVSTLLGAVDLMGKTGMTQQLP